MAPSENHGKRVANMNFFDLPRELRDEIYKHFCDRSPQQQGALEGYVVVPSSSPMRVCKRMCAEFSPLFYESLRVGLLHDRVCLKLPAGGPDGSPSYAGWSIWTHSSKRLFNIWTRRGSEDHSFPGWWMNVDRISPRDGAYNIDPIHRRSSKEIKLLLEILEKLAEVKMLSGANTVARLRSVSSRVAVVAEEFRKAEETQDEITLREARSHGPTFRADVRIGGATVRLTFRTPPPAK